MAAPVAYRLVGGVFEGPVACLHWSHLCTEHLHAFHVSVLSFHVECSLIHHTRHVHQRTHCGCRHAVLSGSGLCYDAFLSHFLCQQYLSDGVVYLVRSRVVEVFALEVEAAAVALAHPLGEVEGRRASHIVAQQRHVLVLKLFRLENGEIFLSQFLHCGIEYFRHIRSAEISVESIFVN